jgi:hypothetical protein
MGGVNITNLGRLGMWNNRKMKFVVFIHNDDVKCFHVNVQGTHKLVLIGCINFEDHVLIERWRASKRMNAMGGKFKDKKKRVTIKNNLHLLVEVVCIFKVLEFIAA